MVKESNLIEMKAKAEKLLKSYIGPDINQGRYPAQYIKAMLLSKDTQLREEDTAMIALVAILNKEYKVYYTDSGYWGDDDFLVVHKTTTLEKVIKELKEEGLRVPSFTQLK